MKKILSFFIILLSIFLSGCSWFEVNKGIDDTETLITIRNWLDEQIPNVVIDDINLPTTYPTINSQIVWSSSHKNIISTTGQFTSPTEDTDVILTAVITLIGSKDTENSYKTYTKTVKAMVVNDEIDNANYLLIVASLDEQIPAYTTQNINLPKSHNEINCTITWKSSNINVINHDGTVYPKQTTNKVTLTATIILANTKEFTWSKEVTVNSLNNQEDLNKVATIKAYLNEVIPKIVTANITLPLSHPTIGSTITWKSSDEVLLSNTGVYGNVTSDKTVYLTATVILDNQYIFTHTLTLTVKVNDEYINNEKMNAVKAWLDSQIPAATSTDLILPLFYSTIPCTIVWESSKINIMNNDGKITNRLVSTTLTLTARITLDNNYQGTFTKTIEIHASSDIESENQLDMIVEYLDSIIPNYVGRDLELPTTFSLFAGSKIQYEILPKGILSIDGKFTFPEQETRLTLLAVITLANGRSRSFIKYLQAIPQNGVTQAIHDVIREIEFHFIDKKFDNDIPASYLITEYKDAKITWTSNNNSVIDGSGKFRKPTYDKPVLLTAKIIIPGLDPYLYEFEVTALGAVPIPEPKNIEKYFKEYIGTTITTDLYLPGKYNEADVKRITDNVTSEDIQVIWSVTSGDISVLVNGNQIVRKDKDVTNITLTAQLLFNNIEIGRFNIYDVTVKAVTKDEMIKYANNFIKKYLQLNVSTGTTLPIVTDKYEVMINWNTSNTNIATVQNGIIDVKATAPNLSSVTLEASLVKNQVLLDKLNYSVNVISSSKVITPELINDHNLYQYLVSKYGIGGKLTTDSFNANSLDNKWFNLDLSYDAIGFYINDLKGIGYITSLRYLNISGQNRITDFTAINSLKNLEALVAKDCNINSLTVNDFSLLSGLSKLYALDLSNNNLTSLTGLEVLNKDKLEILYLANNNISDISLLNEFRNLKALVLSNNKVQDISSLQNLSRLSLLLLDHNLIHDISPLENLKRINTLTLNNQETVKGDNKSQLKDIKVLESINELRALYLQGNIIEDIDCLSPLGKLTTLNASYNNIQNMNIVSDLTSLKYLNLEYNQITGSTSSISRLTQLETLLLEGNNYSAGTYFESSVKDLVNLKALSVSSRNKGFVINDLSFLENLTELHHLSLPYCNIPATYAKVVDEQTITINNLKCITKISNLTYLDISGNNFTDISSLHSLNLLESLYLNDLNISSYEDERGLFILTNFNNLKTLSLVNCNLKTLKFNDEAWIHQLRKLENLNLSYNPFTQIDISDIYNTASAKNLKTLYIDSETPISFIKANYLERFNNLKYLSVINGNLEIAPMFSKALEYLNISNNTEYDLSYLENNPNLKYLIINGITSNISSLSNHTQLKLIAMDLTLSKNMNKDNLETLNKLSLNKTIIIINGDEEFIPDAQTDGIRILSQITDKNTSKGLSIDLENKICQGNELFLASTLNGYDLKWTITLGEETQVIKTPEELCTFLDGKDASGELGVVVETKIYGETVSITYTINFELQKVILVTYKDQNDNVLIVKDIAYGSKPENLNYHVKGYTFNGWYQDLNCQVKYDFNKTLIDNDTIYGKYTPNDYTVTFKINNKVMASRIYTYDNKYDFSDLENPTKPYYTFVGWGISEHDIYYKKKNDALQNIVSLKGDQFKYDANITLSPVWSQTDEYYNYISTPNQLATIDSEESYKLINDITLPENWTPLSEFKGTFDGNGKTITTTGKLQFEIGDDKNIVHGILFNNNSGIIRNLNLKINELTTYATKNSSSYYHKGTYTVHNGGLVGINDGTIENVHITSEKQIINDRNNSVFGTITALNKDKGSIRNCTVNASIYSTGDAGGIAGRNSGTISNCKFTGTIGIYVSEDNGSETLRSWGGIVAYSYGGTVENCKDVKVTFNYHGENGMYHKYTLWWHSKCNLQIKVGVIIGHKEGNATMKDCSFTEGSNKLNKIGGEFHDGEHERKYLFANENGKIGKVS